MEGSKYAEGQPLFLSPFIEEGKCDEGRKLAKVGVLREEIYVESYSGLITVNKEFGSNMFFWYFPSTDHAGSDPLVLYVEGGPGISVFLSAFGQGPYIAGTDGIVRPREKNWTNNHSMLYIDAYMGAGFSFTEKAEGYSTSSVNIAENVYKFLQQFFLLFPERLSNRFYVAGGSYGAHIAPPIARLIISKNLENKQTEINLKKLILFCPWCDPVEQMTYSNFYRTLGLITPAGAEHIHSEEETVKDLIRKGDFASALGRWRDLISNPGGSYFGDISGFVQPMSLLNENPDVFNAGFMSLITQSEFRQALNVGNLTFGGLLNFNVMGALQHDFMSSVRPDIEAVLSKGTPVYMAAGQLDLTVTIPGVERMIDNLKWPGRKQYENSSREIWKVGNRVGGYKNSGGNLTFVLVRNTGHLMFDDQPEWCLQLLKEATTA